jgi:RNA polymerase sigma-70 factor (family 1)
MHQLTDKALLIAEDEQEAFRLLYDRYWQALYLKALYRIGNDADAQDLVQEVFIGLWRNKNNILSQDSLSAYLFTALKYGIIKRVYRQAQKGLIVPLSVEDLEKTELTAEELLHYKELQSVIAAEVAALPERMQEVYRLSRTENLSTKEIAQRLNLSEQTVKNTLSAALKRLREKLARYACWLPFFI